MVEPLFVEFVAKAAKQYNKDYFNHVQTSRCNH